MSSKKIVFLSLYWPPKIWWVESHIFFLTESLLNMGFQVWNIFSDYPENRSSNNNEIRLKLSYKILPISIRMLIAFQKWFFYNHKVLEEADVIHLHDPVCVLWFFPQLIFKKIRKKTFITFHWWGWIFPIPLAEKLVFKIANIFTQWSIYVWDFIDKYYWIKHIKKFPIYWGVNKEKIFIQKSTNTDYIHNKNINTIAFFWRLEMDQNFSNFIESLNRDINPKEYNILIVWDWRQKTLIPTIYKEFSVFHTWFSTTPFAYLKEADVIICSWYLAIQECLFLEKPVISFYDNDLKADYLSHKTPFLKYIVTQDLRKKYNLQSLIKEAIIKEKINKTKIPSFIDISLQYLKLWNKDLH